MKKLSDNELGELLTMTRRMVTIMDEEFSHVSEHVPAEVNRPLNKFVGDLCKEQERRENL